MRRTMVAATLSFSVIVTAYMADAPIVVAYPNGLSGRTLKTTNIGCSNCHGTVANSAITVTITGPATLIPGQVGTYSLKTEKAGAPDGSQTGIDVAADDGASLAVVSGEPTSLLGGEIVHNTPKLTSGGFATYQFKYTMPLSAAVGSTHQLYAVSAITVSSPFSLGWNHAANFTVTAIAPAAPTSATATPASSSSVNLSWAGPTAEFRVVYKAGATPASPTDGTLVYEGANTSGTASGLLPSTSYTFAVYGKVAGADAYSATARTATATTQAATSVIRYVDAVNGNDGGGSNNCLTGMSPCKTITRAMTVASIGTPGDTISVSPGTYNLALGENFPITMKSGVRLIGSGGASSTAIDATGANQRVFNSSGNNASTLIEGFTIRGGFNQPAADGSNSRGGAIYMDSGDQITISRNIFMANEARGYDGVGVSFTSGGQAYGGAVCAFGASPTIVNNVFSGNTARGGHGIDHFGTSTPGGGGGNGDGGAIFAGFGGAATIINNTFHGNQARGGNGGGSLSGAGGIGGNAIAGALEATGASVVNNIFMMNSADGGTGGGGAPVGLSGSGNYGALSYSTAPSATNNLFFGNTASSGSSGDTIGTNAVQQDGLLHGPGNWHLLYYSPAIGAGTAAGAPALDMDGTSRANPPTIGAYESPARSVPPCGQATITNPALNTDVKVGGPGCTGVTLNFSTFSGGSVIVDFYSTGRTGSVPTSNASAYFWTIATTAANVAGTVKIDHGDSLGISVANPTTVELLKRPGYGLPWAQVQSPTRAGTTISTTITGFSEFALGGITSSTTTAVTSSLNPADAGDYVTFTATVSGSGGPPTGTVTFKDGAAILDSASLNAGSASYALLLHAGSHSITAVYGGDGTFAGSTSSVLTQTVTQEVTATTLTSSANPSPSGQPVVFTARVADADPDPSKQAGAPDGNVTFKDGATVLGTVATVNSVASFTTSSLALGSHSITAAYGGNGDFVSSTSAILTQVVSALPGVSIDDPSVQEGNSGNSLLSFTLSLTAAGTSDITVNYATSNGSAIAGTDYTAGAGTFTIPAGVSSKKLVLVVQGDSTVESDETFLVTLSSPTNAVVLKAEGTGTILNDDPPPVATTVTQYRLYHDGTKEHLYTTDLNEYTVLGTVGWIQEGIAYKMLTNGMYGGVATVPLFRMYHPGILQHHWTTDSNETTTLSGTPFWYYEATIGYVVPTQVAGTVPLYRMALANPALHLWTTDLNEYTVLQGLGWIPEGIIGYVVP